MHQKYDSAGAPLSDSAAARRRRPVACASGAPCMRAPPPTTHQRARLLAGSGRLSFEDFARLYADMQSFIEAEEEGSPRAVSATRGRGDDDLPVGLPEGRGGGPPESPRARRELVLAHEMPKERRPGDPPLQPPPISSLDPPVAYPGPAPLPTANVTVFGIQWRGKRSTRRADGAGGAPGARASSNARSRRWGEPSHTTHRTASRSPTRDDGREQQAARRVFGGSGDFGGSSGGVFGGDGEAPSVDKDERGVLTLLSEFAGGKTLHHSQHWVVRAMRALELRYQASAKRDGEERFKLEMHAHGLAQELASHRDALSMAHSERRQVEGDAVRAPCHHPRPLPTSRPAASRPTASRPTASSHQTLMGGGSFYGSQVRFREALQHERETTDALRAHNDGLRRERDGLAAELERARSEIRSMRREAEMLHGRWEQAAHEAAQWSSAAQEAQAETRRALSEANVARDAAGAMERSMLSAQDYRMAEEAGYQLQTIMQLAPSKPIITSVWSQPQEFDAWGVPLRA